MIENSFADAIHPSSRQKIGIVSYPHRNSVIYCTVTTFPVYIQRQILIRNMKEGSLIGSGP